VRSQAKRVEGVTAQGAHGGKGGREETGCAEFNLPRGRWFQKQIRHNRVRERLEAGLPEETEAPATW